jgi:serine/threonine protein phosphatase PrpC
MACIQQAFAASHRELEFSFLNSIQSAVRESSENVVIKQQQKQQPGEWEPIGLPLQSGMDTSINCRHKHPLEDCLDRSLLRNETEKQTSIVALFDGHTNGQVAQLLSRYLVPTKLSQSNFTHVSTATSIGDESTGSTDSLSKLLKPLVKIGKLLLQKSYFSTVIQMTSDGECATLALNKNNHENNNDNKTKTDSVSFDDSERGSIIQLRQCMLLQSNLSLDILAWTVVLGESFFATPQLFLERIFSDWDQLLLLKIANRQHQEHSIHLINSHHENGNVETDSNDGDRNRINRITIPCKLPARHSRFGGCTATVCLIRDDTIHFCWLGDSRAAFFNAANGSLTTTRDHKPNDPKEAARILAKGGSVIHRGVWRVEGRLAMSRSFGDFDLKRGAGYPDVYDADGWVSARPSYLSCPVGAVSAASVDNNNTKKQPLLSEHVQSLVLMASDGFWDVVSEQELEKICRVHAASEHRETASKLACYLRRMAAERGSLDDITVFVATIDLNGGNNKM